MRRSFIPIRVLCLSLLLAACTPKIGETSSALAKQPYQPPAWARGAVVYQLFVPGFTPQGTLKAATKRLPELRDLGVDIIMFMPVYPTGRKNALGEHASPYSVRDYRAIDPALGTADDFRQFVQAAHQLGMHVLMDLVANHTAWDNALITEHPDWYTHDGAGAIISPNPDWRDVADLNYDNAALRAYMIETSRYWIDNFGIDGYRADASMLVPDDFWKAWREALKAKHPNLLLLSESDKPDLYTAGFEAAYDWTTLPNFVRALQSPAQAGSQLDYITSDQDPEHIPAWHLRYLENNDQDRIAKVAVTLEQRKLAAAYLLTLPGLPLIFTGQEVGALNRPTWDWSPVDWASGDEALRETYTGLIRLRKASPALREGTFTPLNGAPVGVLAFERAAGSARVVVALNFNAAPVDVAIQETAGGKDLQTGEKMQTGSFKINGYGFKLIQAP